MNTGSSKRSSNRKQTKDNYAGGTFTYVPKSIITWTMYIILFIYIIFIFIPGLGNIILRINHGAEAPLFLGSGVYVKEMVTYFFIFITVAFLMALLGENTNDDSEIGRRDKYINDKVADTVENINFVNQSKLQFQREMRDSKESKVESSPTQSPPKKSD